MEITEVRVKLIQNPSDRLKAFCSVTFDGDFVIRDIKVIEGTGGVFVAMPSRKLSDHCPKCHSKNHLRAQYCNECGAALGKERVRCDDAGRRKLHADIAHPINSECRQSLQECVVEAFEKESDASKNPDYQPANYDDDYNEEEAEAVAEVEEVEEVEEIEEVDVINTSDDDDEAAGPDAYGQMILELKRDAADRRTGTNRTSGRTPRVAPAPHAVNAKSGTDADDAIVEKVARVQPKPPAPHAANAKSGRDADDAVVEKVARVQPKPPAPDRAPPPPPPSPSPSFSDDDGFGAGLEPKRVSRKPPETRAEPKREPKRAPERTPERAPEPAVVEADDGDDFGAGLL